MPLPLWLTVAATVIFCYCVAPTNAAGGPIVTDARLGAFCGARYFHPGGYPTCSYPVQSCWPTDHTVTPPRQTNKGELTIYIQPTPVLPPLVNINGRWDEPDYKNTTLNYPSSFDGKTITEWFNPFVTPDKFPDLITFPIPWCGGELGYDVDFAEAFIHCLPSDIRGQNDPGLFPEECRGPLLYNYKPICASPSGQLLETNCLIPDGPGPCIDSQFSPEPVTWPPYNPNPSILAPTQGFPYVPEAYAIGAYTPRQECVGWGIDTVLPGIWETKDMGMYGPMSYPSPYFNTVTYKRPAACTPALFESLYGPSRALFKLRWSGLYNRLDYGPVLVDYDEPTSYAPGKNRIFYAAGLQCQTDAPRSLNSPAPVLDNIATASAACRVTFPYDASLYGSGAALDAYLEATGGVYQPAGVPMNTVIVSARISGIPGTNYSIYYNMYAEQDAETVQITANPIYVQNGDFGMYAIPAPTDPDKSKSGWHVLKMLFNRNEPIKTAVDLRDMYWIPPCACNSTTFSAVAANVYCQPSSYDLIAGGMLSRFFPDTRRFIANPICTIVASSDTPYVANTEGYVFQGQPYKYTVQINGSSGDSFSVLWFAKDPGFTVLEFSAATSTTTSVELVGEDATVMGVAVTSQTTGAQTACYVTLQPYVGCAVPRLRASATSTDLNVTTVLEVAFPTMTSGGLEYTTEWSMLTTVPAGIPSSAYTISDPTLVATTFSASLPGVYHVIVRVSSRDAGTGGTPCVVSDVVSITVINATAPVRNIVNPDRFATNGSCFDDAKNFTEPIPPVVDYVGNINQTEYPFYPISDTYFTADLANGGGSSTVTSSVTGVAIAAFRFLTRTGSSNAADSNSTAPVSDAAEDDPYRLGLTIALASVLGAWLIIYALVSLCSKGRCLKTMARIADCCRKERDMFDLPPEKPETEASEAPEARSSQLFFGPSPTKRKKPRHRR